MQEKLENIFQSLEQFFLTVGQNNFGNKIPILYSYYKHTSSRFKGP